jgi:uncharacterized membrane protein
MTEIIVTKSIRAPVARVWSIMSDIERWPEWTPTITTVERLDRAPLGVGARVRIAQPKLRPAVWTITEWKSDEQFIWESRAPGLRTVAEHSVRADASGCSVRLVVRFEGLLGALVGRMYGRLTAEYMELEAEGLRARSEGAM